jgi:hypothetical protein
MPMALLLQNQLKAFKKGANRLTPWIEVVRLESRLIARARNAFLVHWFGSGVPLQSLYLRIAIHNLDELRARYREVTSEVRPRSRGPNLTEPLAGLAGTLVGALLSPSGAIMASYLISRFLWQAAGRVVAILGALVAGPLISAIGATAGILLLPVGLLFGIIGGTFSRGALREGHDLLGSLASLLITVTDFINQLLGPRENIRNPLVRQILELLGRVAVLFTLILAAFAVLVTRVGPLVFPLMLQGLAFINLIDAVIDLLEEILDSFFAPIVGMGVTCLNPLESANEVIDALKSVFPLVLRRMTSMMGEMAGILLVGVFPALPQVASWFLRVARVINRSIIQHWVFRGILAAINQIRIIRSAIPSSPESSSGGSGFSIPALPLAPPLPTLPELPNVGKVERQAGGQPGFPISLPSFAGATRHFAPQFRHMPTSVFAGERARIRQELGREPSDELAEIRNRELQYRDHLFRVVGQILPPEIRVRMPELLSMFRSVDRHLYERNVREPERNFPVLDLPDNGRLRPVVHQLTIRAIGCDENAARRFKDALVQSLSGQTYLAPATP